MKRNKTTGCDIMKKVNQLTETICEYTDKLIKGEEPDSGYYLIKYPEFRDSLIVYFDALGKLSSALKPVSPPPQLVQNVISAVKSTQSVPVITPLLQRIIGHAVCDEEFRRSLLLNPEEACMNAGYRLSTIEIAAIKSLDFEGMEKFSSNLDERITKRGAPSGDAMAGGG